MDEVTNGRISKNESRRLARNPCKVEFSGRIESVELNPKVEKTNNECKKVDNILKFKNIFKCHLCRKEFSSKGNLKKHTNNVHGGNKSYKCGECNIGFVDNFNLKRYKISVHGGVQQRTNDCPTCGKQFSCRDNLKKHITEIHEEKKYNCELCDKKFSQAWGMKQHIETVHDGQKNHKCENCGNSFAQSGTLFNHKKSCV